MRILYGPTNRGSTSAGMVERIMLRIAMLVLRRASITEPGQHRILAPELEIRLVTQFLGCMRYLGKRYDLRDAGFRLREAHLHAAGIISRGFGVAPADIDRHHSIRFVILAEHGLDVIAESVIRNPDMPAPHNAAVRITHGDDGVALFDRRLRHVENQVVPVGSETDIRHKILFILPDEYGIPGCTVRIVVDIGIGDGPH